MVREGSATATIAEEPASPAMPASPPVPRSTANSLYRVNPFDTPLMTPNRSRRPSLSERPSLGDLPSGGSGYFSRSTGRAPPQKPYFRSRRIRKEDVHTPRELDQMKDPKAKWIWILPLIGVSIGIAISAVLIYLNVRSVQSKYNYCPVLMEDFSSGTLDPKVWFIEQQVGGFGNGEFEETTPMGENLFIRNSQLYIKPTLQDQSLINKNSIINLTQTGVCTSTTWSDCVASTNTTNGTIVNPVKSARINSKLGANIKYGRVEVVAKIPKGDWLWPAIWMQATDDVYGAWPRSGEIDILESRGNNYTYEAGYGGNNIAQSTLHWGPDSKNDGYLHTTNTKAANHQQWGDEFHTWGLEWSENYLFTYIDSRLLQVLYVPFNKPLYPEGDFPPVDTTNGTALTNPWANTGHDSSPFDQLFYLTLNVAVGGTNGWFPDGVGGKPWVDSSPVAKSEFWDARNQWYPTWQENGEMIIDSVKMWQQC